MHTLLITMILMLSQSLHAQVDATPIAYIAANPIEFTDNFTKSQVLIKQITFSLALFSLS